MDRALFPFETLRASGVPDDNGDKAFDDEPLATPSVTAEASEPTAAGNPPAARTVIPIATEAS